MDHGELILQHLFSEPHITAPVVLARLKQKDQEWCRAKREWNKSWRAATEKTFSKTMTQKVGSYRMAERKILSPKGNVVVLCSQFTSRSTSG